MNPKTYQIDAVGNKANELLQQLAEMAPELTKLMVYVDTLGLDDALQTTATEYAEFVADSTQHSEAVDDGDGGTTRNFKPSTALRVDNEGNLIGPRDQKLLSDYAEMLGLAAEFVEFASDPDRAAVLQRQSVIR